MYRNKTSTVAARESPKFKFDVRDRVIIARAIVLAEECVDAMGSPALAETYVGHGQAIEYGHVNHRAKDVRGYPIH